MAYPTLRDLVTLALHDAGIAGVGQTPLAEDFSQAVTRFNWMIGQWNRKRWLVWALRTLSLTATGAQTYTIGPGGNFDTGALSPRPEAIESTFARLLQGTTPDNRVDFPLSIISSREDYNLISLKQLQTFPQALYYSPDFPLGTIFVWPIPSSLYGIHVTVKVVLEKVANESDELAWPEEYFQALNLNLQVLLREAYNLPPKPVTLQLAKAALSTIRGANAQISALHMPANLRGRNYSGNSYNVYSDNY